MNIELYSRLTRKSLALSLICVMALSGCTKGSSLLKGHGNRIRVNAMIGTATKGAQMTTDGLMSFCMDAVIGPESDVGPANSVYFSGALASRTAVGQPWSMTPEYMWVDATDIHFWSYAPSSPNGTLDITQESAYGQENIIKFDFETASNPTDQDDLIFAYSCENRAFDDNKENITSGTTKVGDADPVPNSSDEVDVTFYHALSEISFTLSIADGTFDADLKIDSITLENVISEGSCIYTGTSGKSGFAWTPEASSCEDFTISGLGTATFAQVAVLGGNTAWQYNSTKSLFTTKNLFFVIPQDHRSSSTQGLDDAFISVAFHRISTGNSDRLKVKIEDLWEAGKYYKYKIKAATTVATKILLDYELNVEDWVDGSGKLSL